MAMLLVGLLFACMLGSEGVIQLEHLSTVYVPSSYDPLTFGYNVEAAEQAAVDSQAPYVYAAGELSVCWLVGWLGSRWRLAEWVD